MEFLRLLADAGDSIKTAQGIKPLSLQNICGNVLIHSAISIGSIEDVKNLIKLGISVHVKVDDKTPLCRAVENGDGEIIDILAACGANIQERTRSNVSLLHFAVSKGFADAVDALVSAGLPVDSKDREGLTPLYRAAERGDLDTAEVLLDNGASIITELGSTFLHLAVKRKCVNAIRCFADLGFNMDCTDADLATPIYKAAEAGNVDIIKELIENGADLYSRDYDGHSFLHIAAQEGNVVAARTLINAGMDVDVKGSWWNSTPLHIAVAKGELLIAQLLVERHASINIKTSDGRTPLYIAQCNGDSRMIRYLSSVKPR